MCSSLGVAKFIMKNINMTMHVFFLVSIKAIYLKNEFI